MSLKLITKKFKFDMFYSNNLAVLKFNVIKISWLLSCRAWPNITCIDQKWTKLINPFFSILLQHNVVYTDADSRRWIKVEEAIFDLLDQNETREVVLRVLLSAKVPVVSVPIHVTKAISDYISVKEIKPSLVRSTMKKIPSFYKKLNRHEKLLLLNFCLKDGKFDSLCDLELLPISDGNFIKFNNQSEPVYICSREHPRELFPGLEHGFLDETIGEAITQRLESAGKQGKITFSFHDVRLSILLA